MVRDVLPIAEIQPLALSLSRDPDGFVLRATNPNGDHVEGEAALVLWAHEGAPAPQQFRLAGGETAELRFEGTGARAVARMTWYGQVQYVEAEG